VTRPEIRANPAVADSAVASKIIAGEIRRAISGRGATSVPQLSEMLSKLRQRTRVKICCMASIEEARLAIRHGADAVGLVSAMPSGPGPIDESLIASIADSLPPMLGSFLLTSLQDPHAIVAQLRRCRANTLQLVDDLPLDGYRVLRDELPGISIVQVLHVRNEDAINQAVRVAQLVDGILLDSGNPSLTVKELGGTGRVHDWEISRAVVEAVKTPVILAGGLTSGNVRQAIRQVRPFGVDVCSGVRTRGALDELKLAAFMAAVVHEDHHSS
jgi:phosphoribosylanthranilate isomerase